MDHQRPLFLRLGPRSLGPLALLALCFACSPPPGPIQRYEVRAELRQLPDGANGDLLIRHEAIDGFTDRDGKRVGMDPMSMPFPLAEGIDLSGYAPGDRVRCTLEVDWQQRAPVKITAIEKLPADTKLEYREAKP